MADDFKQKINAPAWHAEKPYDADEAIRLERACEFLCDHRVELALDRPYDLLDVGCGVGPLRQWLGPEEFRIVGLEIGEAAAAIARQSYDACEVCDVEAAWPVAAGSFDGLHAGAVMEHVLDWHAPLNHANTALRDGGLLVVTVPNLRYWKEVRRLLGGRQPHWLRDMKHVHGYTPRFLCELVGLHGFEVCRLEADRVNLPLLPKKSRWVCRRFAKWGSVLILAARLVRRVRVEDHGRAGEFPNHKEVGSRSIEVLGGEEAE
jgi:SAM-dependent methyltransferase